MKFSLEKFNQFFKLKIAKGMEELVTDSVVKTDSTHNVVLFFLNF